MLKEAFQIMKTGHTSTLKTILVEYHDCDWKGMALVIKNSPANTGEVRDSGSSLGSGRSPGEGNGNPFQYSFLENSMDRGAWWATFHRVSKIQT